MCYIFLNLEKIAKKILEKAFFFILGVPFASIEFSIKILKTDFFFFLGFVKSNIKKKEFILNCRMPPTKVQIKKKLGLCD
jgi:hypothetical protein